MKNGKQRGTGVKEFRVKAVGLVSHAVVESCSVLLSAKLFETQIQFVFTRSWGPLNTEMQSPNSFIQEYFAAILEYAIRSMEKIPKV